VENTILLIGDLSITLPAAAVSSAGNDRYLPFRGEDLAHQEDWLVQTGLPPPELYSSTPSPTRWAVSRRKNKKLFQLRLGRNNSSWWKTALMEEDCSRGEIWWNQKLAGRRSGPLFCLDIFLWAHLLLSRNGLIIHAAALGREGEAYLFPGPTGSGKSTWSELAAADPEWEILGEDKVVLRRVGENYFIYGSPWNPRPAYRSAARGVLRGVFFLHPGGFNRLTILPPAATFQRLLRACFLPFSDPAEMEEVLSLLQEVSGNFPGRVFSFQPDRSALPFWRERR